MPKNDGTFKFQFHNTNLALKMPEWATIMPKWEEKMLQLATCFLIFVAKKKWRFLVNKKPLAFWHNEIDPRYILKDS